MIQVQLHLNTLARDFWMHRKNKHHNLREVAACLGTSPSTLSRVEHGRLVDLTTYILVCRYLNRPFQHYFTVHDQEENPPDGPPGRVAQASLLPAPLQA